MSIFRGANKTVQVIKKSKDLTLLHPNSEKQELMNELKLLLKENTLLKQENLDLKQQIMLGKIEIQNLKIKFQQLTCKPNTIVPSLKLDAITSQSQTLNMHKNGREKKIETLTTDRTTTSALKNPSYKEHKDSIFLPRGTSVSKKMASFKSIQLKKHSENKENHQRRSNQGRQLSRKDQIMAKYQSLIQNEYEGDLSIDDRE